MKIAWIGCVFLISFLLMAILKAHEISSLKPFYRSYPSIKLKNFETSKKGLPRHELDLLKLWESILTGRSAPVRKWMKERYKKLGLSHLFTPSGFHLSAVLMPVMKVVKSMRAQLIFLMLIAGGIFLLKGQGALKRMILIKLNQRWLGSQAGFICALILDILLGTFSEGAVSFTYSFLFLGIIYSGVKNLNLLLLFFLAQMMIAYFNGEVLSPLILLFSPILNFSFGLLMPFLFLLAIPLWHWQLKSGLFLLNILQVLVDTFAGLVVLLPSWEIHFGWGLVILLFMKKRRIGIYIVMLFMTNELNLDKGRTPGFGRYDFKPRGAVLKILHKHDKDVIYFSDGKCERRLVRGYWWEKCSPKRRRSIKKLGNFEVFH